MQTQDTRKHLSEYNRIFKENDDLYRSAAKSLGLSDCAFWILYALREDKGELTQSALCESTYLPKQTINSALKKLEQDGCIELKEMRDRRSKKVCLTPKGIQLAEKTVDRVIAAEQDAFAGLAAEEIERFLQLYRKYTALLKANMPKSDST
ncbi:MarR family winged helix-turn-helix transcriptional regulator [Hominifimenecus sp. rT4P-3]|uniref:MarR family winged helix-turn-helix transcriptional regulator n=1 Tax=Hominifimenecus sp. rT4P-3 TaxID=3242979 RepID=UPI003DA515CC